MKKSIVFVMPMYYGHTNRTISLAKTFENLGFEVIYAGTRELIFFTIKNNFKLYELQTLPFDFVPLNTSSMTEKEKIEVKVNHRKNDEAFLKRKEELGVMMQKLKPSMVLLDEFYFTDFICLYQFLPRCRISILQGKYGMYYNSVLPPSNFYFFPSIFNRFIWHFEFLKNQLDLFRKSIKYKKFTRNKQILRAMKLEKLPEKYAINRHKIFTESFTEVNEWLLFPPELDFPQEKLQPWQTYFPPIFYEKKNEIISQEVREFLEKKGDKKLIYCTLGTISDIHLKKNIALKNHFFETIFTLTKTHSDYVFILGLGNSMEINNDWRQFPNLLVQNFVPHQHILKHADVFYTHGGLTSIFDAIHAAVPMLLFPISNQWDFNGTVARIVFHGLGIKANLTESATSIWQKTERLKKDIYRTRLNQISETLQKKYTKNYLAERLEEIGLYDI